MTAEDVARLGVPEIVEAERKLEMISQDRQLRVEYERRRMAHHDAVSLRRDSLAEGRKEGRAESILLVLQARGGTVSEEIRQRILSCQDPALLERWVVRAATASMADDLFREE